MLSLTFAIGDVHGCLEILQSLLAACEAHAAGRPARYIFLGDYIDRGPDSRGVIQLLMRRQQAQPGTNICLRGNHEQMAITAHESALVRPFWLKNGGMATVGNYAGNNGRIEDSHLAWLRTLPFYYDDGRRFFVHAGIDLAKPLNEQSNEGMLWTREPFLSFCDQIDCGRFIVHGHTPLQTGKPDLRTRRINLDTAAVTGGALTAAVFDDTRAEPLGYLTARDMK
jgi:serine/threonine protein phosphatase 1